MDLIVRDNDNSLFRCLSKEQEFHLITEVERAIEDFVANHINDDIEIYTEINFHKD